MHFDDDDDEEDDDGYVDEIINGRSHSHQQPPPKSEQLLESVPINDDDDDDAESDAVRGAATITTAAAANDDVLLERAEGGDQFLSISITEPQRVGDGMGAYMAYRVSTKTNMQIFKQREFTVQRRFSDFLGLHDKLTEKYLKVGRIIPPAPEKSVIGKKIYLVFF